MKRIIFVSIIVVAGLLVLATNKRASAQPQATAQPQQSSGQMQSRTPPTPVHSSAIAVDRLKWFNQAQTKARTPSKTPLAPSPRSQAVVLEASEVYTYEQISCDSYNDAYAGFWVINSSSSPGAPTFPQLAWNYNSSCFTVTNECGGLFGGGTYTQCGSLTGLPPEPMQLADALAQLMDDGFKIISIQTPSGQGYGPMQFVLVKTHE
jgi:hypothetical protein